MSRQIKIDKSKTNQSVLWKLEQKWIAWAVPKVPNFLNGRNLTWATALWAVLMILFGYLTRYNKHWIWGVSAAIVAQYITDSLDGAVGRYRNSGWVNWGHYVDHLLDFIFLCSVVISYALILPDQILMLLILLALFGSHYASTFLHFSFSHKFRMAASGIGMNELKIGLIIMNGSIIVFGTGFVENVLMILSALALLTLLIVIYFAQKEASRIDRQCKKERSFCN
ncbi:MAG: CDP-alcohol phosphatidyltransferase family protein [Candidatus Zixiibacteriota bacterium]